MRGVRHTDPWTSWVVAWEDSDDRSIRSVILSALRTFGPMTHTELVEGVNRLRPASPSGVRSRCAELVDAGLVEAVPGMIAKTEYGRSSLLWRAVQ